ncbi:hypothetical protein ABMA58_20600, partial [Oceanospirillum sp. HFRX-1_2]
MSQLQRQIEQSLPEEPRILAVDVQYQAGVNDLSDTAYVAGVLFSGWQAEQADAEYRCRVSPVAEYDPGAFYRRELPCILQLLEQH